MQPRQRLIRPPTRRKLLSNKFPSIACKDILATDAPGTVVPCAGTYRVRIMDFSQITLGDPHNGLLLLPQYDRLFDRGYITFDGDGRVVFSDALPSELVPKLGVRDEDRLRFVNDQHRPFFEYHRRSVFITSVTNGPEEALQA